MDKLTESYWVFSIGFLAQSLFGARIVVQWWITEKKKQVVSSSLFWKFSLGGATLFLIYGVLRTDIVIIAGQLISYIIYIRNLQFKGDWYKFSPLTKTVLVFIPVGSVISALGIEYEVSFINVLRQDLNIYLTAGIAGQLLLSFRFLYQLYRSEQEKKSVLPVGFWWLSVGGAILIITYATYRHDPVLLLAQGLAIVPYARNLVLGSKNA